MARDTNPKPLLDSLSRRRLLQIVGGTAGFASLTGSSVAARQPIETPEELSTLRQTAQVLQSAESTTTVGAVTGFTADGNTYHISAGAVQIRVIFYDDDVFRIWLAPNGEFTDPANADNSGPDTDIVVKRDYSPPQTQSSDEGEYYRISTAHVTLRVYKDPLRFALHDADGTLVWEEETGLTWSKNGTVQTLRRGENEQFFGGGMQNGRFSHRGETIDISRSFDWNDGGHPNPAPFYMSTAGYGVFRNTYEPGTYSFTDPYTSIHQEQRFDAYYFYGPELKQILDGYTELTGRPFMPPIYGLELGDADCYNDDGESTYPAAVEAAQEYVEHDMPRGWMLVNDGYGCGYVQLERVVNELLARNIRTGLWTENDLTRQEYEINVGVRVRKLDVAWVGQGYEFAMNAAQTAYNGIENYSDARGYVWMVEGWAGAQRYATMWTGDQYGTWENIRFHIPTLHGSGLSSQVWVGSDVDGIFGGSAKTYTRDLQWKMFTPTFLTMSGWAPKDKHPWVYGEPYTSINRKYLRLRERLLPYFYTYAAAANRTGTPLIRSLVLEYPDDQRTWNDETTKYEFLAGEWFLVAPVYEDTTTWDDIYLPEDRWIDYWTGTVHEGPRIANNYYAPLDRLPLFVKGGAIIPMWPDGTNNHREVADDAPITFDIYPQGETSFTLYEDDGVTREHKQGKFAEQTVTCSAPETGRGKVEITVGQSEGKYDGKPSARPYRFHVHTGSKPAKVTLGHSRLDELSMKQAYEHASEGWFYDENDRGGIVYIKTERMPTDDSFTVSLRATSAVGGPRPIEAKLPAWVSVDAPALVKQDSTNEVTVTFTNEDEHKLSDVHLSLDVPDHWMVDTNTPTLFKHVGSGESVMATFSVTPPEDAPQDTFDLVASAEFTVRGDTHTVTDTVSVKTPPPPPTRDVWASDLEWVSATNGWGPVERDMSNGSLNANDGQPITLDGVTYEKGLGVHAYSNVKYYLAGNCSRFTAKIGVDDEISDYGSVVFHVIADDEEVFVSDTLTGTSPTGTVDVSIEGAEYVNLVVTNADDGKTGDHADWAAAKFHATD